jgi:glycine hydroxymethyltransferase
MTGAKDQWMSYADYTFGKPLSEIDSEVAHLIRLEEERQNRKIIMIPSESICPSPVLEALGSVFNNIYAEGYPPGMMTEETDEEICEYNFQLARYRRYSDRRFYKGCEYANFLETLACRRAASLFATELNPAENIYVNIQPLSGAAANNSVYDAFVSPGDVVMGMSLMHGGHLTHGSEFNRSGKNYSIVSYEVDAKTEKLNYDAIMDLAEQHRPGMVIAGYTSYPWAPDWVKFREICDSVGAVLLADVSHPAGLITAGVYPNPLDYADVITFTTHKTLFGPRGAVIMTAKREYAERIEQAVFPGEQGGPHVNKFAALSVAFNIAKSAEFKKTQRSIVENARHLGDVLQKNGLKLAYGGTDTHIVLVDLAAIKTRSGYPLKGEIAVRMLDIAGIVANKNTIPGDTVTAEASGVRLGTPWITQRGITKQGIEELGSIIADVLKNISPFSYIGLTGDLPRGKINLELLEKSQARVEKLAGQLLSENKMANTGYPHFRKHHPLQEVREPTDDPFKGKPQLNRKSLWPEGSSAIFVKGARADQFLEGVIVGKVTTLEARGTLKTFFIDDRAELIAPAIIYRLVPLKNQEHGFVVLCRTLDKERLITWLRGISDGYIIFDREDIFRKVEGPAVVLDAEEIQEGELEDISGKTIDEMFTAIKEKEEKPGIPEFDKGTDVDVLFDVHSEYFDLSKPFFIGQQRLLEKYPKKGKEEKGKKVFNYQKGKSDPKESCLYAEHLKLTNNIVDFAGWKMPLRYESTSEEHRAVRERAGLFDISHMGIFEISGTFATQFLDVITTNYVPWINNNESQYSYLLDTEGGIIDDIMVYRFSSERYMVVVNAVNNDKDLAWIKAVNSRNFVIDNDNSVKEIPAEVKITDLKNPEDADGSGTGVSLVDLALQGPRSLEILKKIAPDDRSREMLGRLEKNRFIETELGGIYAVVSRTGYTGEEFGYELFLSPEKAPAFWNLVLDAGRDEGVKPVGLGARDSLRIEAGLPLYGHELAGTFNLSPIEAGFGPYVKFHKPFFIGRRALLAKMKSITREVVRFKMLSKGVRIAKPEDPVASSRTQRIIGGLTSCAVDKDGYQVGMACIDRKFSREGLRIEIIPGFHEGRKNLGDLRELAVGDKYPFHTGAVVLSRFPERD